MAETFRRRHLPHWDRDGATYFVTSCLNGSIPASGLVDINRFREEQQKRPRPEGMSQEDWNIRLDKLLFARWDEWLDREPAARHFADESLAKLMVATLKHFAGQRYDLWAYVVMPSHFHWVFRSSDSWVEACKANGKQSSPRERIMQSVKRFSANECNRILELSGTFWQQESYDHIVRDDDELYRIIEYVEVNPVRAGLCSRKEDYLFSSARDRVLTGVPYTLPLRP